MYVDYAAGPQYTHRIDRDQTANYIKQSQVLIVTHLPCARKSKMKNLFLSIAKWAIARLRRRRKKNEKQTNVEHDAKLFENKKNRTKKIAKSHGARINGDFFACLFR